MIIYTCKVCNEKCKGTDDFDKHLQYTHGTNHWTINLALKETKRQFANMFGEK